MNSWLQRRHVPHSYTVRFGACASIISHLQPKSAQFQCRCLQSGIGCENSFLKYWRSFCLLTSPIRSIPRERLKGAGPLKCSHRRSGLIAGASQARPARRSRAQAEVVLDILHSRAFALPLSVLFGLSALLFPRAARSGELLSPAIRYGSLHWSGALPETPALRCL